MDSANALFLSRFKATIKIFPPLSFFFSPLRGGQGLRPCGFGVLGFPYIPLGVSKFFHTNFLMSTLFSKKF